MRTAFRGERVVEARLLVISLWLAFTFAAWAAAEKPNFILIVVDDLGWTDLGCTGSRLHETPNIDKLAAEGMKFTQAYAACTVCSPTRAAILTGKYPARLHITDWIEGHQRPKAKLKVPDWTRYLPLEEVTLAEALKEGGYVSASIGKWHLGGEEYSPEKQGFDHNIGGTHRGQPPSYLSPYRIPTLKNGSPGEYLTDREAAEAVRFIEEQRARPFFLYLPHYAVHNPLQAKAGLVAKYRGKLEPGAPHSHPVYAAMVESVDRALGRIVSTLADLKLSRRTVIIFTSDNGGLVRNRGENRTLNTPLRAGKGSAYEGGVRVPLIIKWPGVTEPGSVSEEPVMSIDFYPTFLAMAGQKPREGQVIDGASLVPLLRQEGNLNRAELYWHYPHYHPGGATPYGAIRQGDFKLIEFYEDGKFELYNLKEDIGETNNLAETQLLKVRQLGNRLEAWRKHVGAQMPAKNPDYEGGKQ